MAFFCFSFQYSSNSSSSPDLLEDDNPNNDAAACGKLGAFINHVEAQAGKKKITHEQAEELTATARAIEDQIGC